MVSNPLQLAISASVRHGNISEPVVRLVLELQGRIDRVNDVRSNSENTVYKLLECTSYDGKLITGEVMIQIDEKHDTFAIVIKSGEEMVAEHTALNGDAEALDEDGNPLGVRVSGGKKNSDDIKISPLVRSTHDVS